MARIVLKKEMFEKLSAFIKSKPFAEVEAMGATLSAKVALEAKAFEDEEIIPILNYLYNRPFSEVHNVLRKLLTFNDDGTSKLNDDALEVPLPEPVVQPEVVASPPETSIPF